MNHLNKIAQDFIHGSGFSIGDFNLIEEGVRVGDNVTLKNYVELRKGTVIGKKTIIESGAQIGAQPYTFTDDRDLIIPEFGVTIGDDVWIGAKCIIMRGTERDTYLGKNVKVAQFCNVGHDSIIEDGASISAGALMGGFARVGENADIAMGVTIRNRVSVGRLSLVGQESNVVKAIPDNVVAYGNPCRVIRRRYNLLKYTLRRLRG